jgi:hypothetical protein
MVEVMISFDYKVGEDTKRRTLEAEAAGGGRAHGKNCSGSSSLVCSATFFQGWY